MLASRRHYLRLDFLCQLVMLRTTRRFVHIGLCAGLLCLAAPVYAYRLITKTQADPDVIFVNESTQVTIKVQLAPGTKQAPTLKLFRRNGDGNDTKLLGLLYDDGTHGDSIAGDHIFVGEFTFDEKRVSKILLSIEVNGKRIEEDEDNDDNGDKQRDQDEGHKRRHPLPLSIDVVRRPSAFSLQPILDAQQNGTQLFDSLRTQVGETAARSAMLKFLRRQPGVAKADISPMASTFLLLT